MIVKPDHTARDIAEFYTDYNREALARAIEQYASHRVAEKAKIPSLGELVHSVRDDALYQGFPEGSEEKLNALILKEAAHRRAEIRKALDILETYLPESS